MRKGRVALLFVCALLLVGNGSFCFAAAKGAAKSSSKVSSELTRDTRALFGHNVDGLQPVTISVCNDAPFNSLSDVMFVNFMKLVEAESKGKIKFDAHRFGSLYRQNEYGKVVNMGTIDMANIAKGSLMRSQRAFSPWLIGYVWKNPEHPISMASSQEWYDVENRLLKEKWNLKLLTGWNYGNWDYWSKKEVKSMDGFRGKKIWTYGDLPSAYIAAWGGTPVNKSYSELYMAYYNDVVNIVSGSISLYHDYKFYEGGKYCLNMPAYPPGAITHHYGGIYMNGNKWNALPAAYKKIILDAVDLWTWNHSYEMLCMEKLQFYRLVNQYKIIDVGIATKYPKEYEKIKNAAVEAGKKFVFKQGCTEAEWNEARGLVAKYGDPKYTAQYSWWYKKAWAESNRRLAEVRKALTAGKSWRDAYDMFHAKSQYEWTAEQVKNAWMATPRVKVSWSEESRLQ